MQIMHDDALQNISQPTILSAFNNSFSAVIPTVDKARAVKVKKSCVLM